jgi:hypothetical protein
MNVKLTALLILAGIAAPHAEAKHRKWKSFAPPHREYRPLSSEDLERHVERVVKARLGPWVDDVDVDVDTKRGRVEIEVELEHRLPFGYVRQVVYSIPELRGFQIRLEIDD